MARADRKSATDTPLTRMSVPVDRLFPNPWNVNEMTPQMFQKEIASIRRYGFVDPLLVRPHPWEPGAWQIIDGEHRFLAGKEIGLDSFPCDIIDVDDDTAQELSIVLNDLHGESDRVKLASLVRSLAKKRGAESLSEVLPYTSEQLTQMLGRMQESKIDFSALQEQRQKLTRGDGWVERVFRMPSESATVVDDALKRIMEVEQLDDEWRALEFMAADSLAG
jgi:ParB family transcriptional regulator, chromosome partitioning protein